MNRLNFLKEMQISLLKTAKFIYEPFLEEDTNKLEIATDRILGVEWKTVCRESEVNEGIELKFFNGFPIIIIRSEKNVRAFSGICPSCSQILMISTLYATGKCVQCEKDTDFLQGSGKLEITEYPIRLQEGYLQISFWNRTKNRNDDHA
ncbi:Rieske (2Fe-2S) protein [Bacillus massilinigeriensis]|uniref:hypothetical protein n=1 Tax=Bacillus mediterraneensis TaxID=1805474 RepID=UPI0008F87C6D|nr:hypothetical protein [Bacillus mediterraneensis]